MKSSCIRHPVVNRYIQLNKWQVVFCQNDHAAAMLLAHFIAWHDWKLAHDEFYRRHNDIAEAHGEGRPQNQNAYLFFTTDDLITALMGLFGKKSIKQGLDLLVALNVISVCNNPNPRYRFDKTKYFQFYPEVCNEWLSHYDEKIQNNTQVVDNYDNAKMADRCAPKSQPSAPKSQPSAPRSRAITDTTYNTTYNTQSRRAHASNLLQEKKSTAEKHSLVQPVIHALLEKGLSPQKIYADALEEITTLLQQGATIDLFMQAYEISLSKSHQGHFGLNYLIKVTKSLMAPANVLVNKSTKIPLVCPNDVYQQDLTNGMSWIYGEEKNGA